MMVKNEERYLESCLQSLELLREAIKSELIIVDTGSSDNTVSIARRFTNKVYFHQWNDDFSAMRNTTISYAKGEWIYIIDGDEVLESHQLLIDFLSSPKRKKYSAVAITGKNVINIETGAFSCLLGYRLFKNDAFFHYEGAIHNQPIFRGASLSIPEVSVRHYGYVTNDEELMERKFLRTSAILKRELEKDPNNEYYWTQLSVTYGMHNDYTESLRCAEKAYSLLPQKKTANYMYVLIQLMLVYQHEAIYEKVAEVCRESLAIKEGYLDVYYYYGEAQAMLKNYQEAIIYYEKYLNVLGGNKRASLTDTSIIEYTIECKELVYYNLFQLTKAEKQYDRAMFYAEKISKQPYFTDSMPGVIELYMELRRFDELRSFYETKIAGVEEQLFVEKMFEQIAHFDYACKLGVATVFNDIGGIFGLYCLLFLDDRQGELSLSTRELVDKANLANIPIFCSDILYYLIKLRYPLNNCLQHFNEEWLASAMEYIAQKHDNICELLYRYLENQSACADLMEYKLRNALARYTLLFDQLDDNKYMNLFTYYIEEGIAYLQAIYSEFVIMGKQVIALKNNEEIFWLYLNYAKQYASASNEESVNYLHLAVKHFPQMKRGAELLYKQLQTNEKWQPIEGAYNNSQIKAAIREMIDAENLEEAKFLLQEYKSRMPNDMEAILLESNIMLADLNK